MNKLLRRLFENEIEILFRFQSRLGLPNFRRKRAMVDLAVRRKPRLPHKTAGSKSAERGTPPGRFKELPFVQFLGRHCIAIISISCSVLIHTVLLGMLDRIRFQENRYETLEKIQITLRIPGLYPEQEMNAIPLPEEETPRPVEIPKLPDAPAPEATPLEEPDPTLLPGPVEEITQEEIDDEKPQDEPGFPGTGNVARAEPEGRPGPPRILGVGSSPPPGDSFGLGGEGEGWGTGRRSRGKAGALRRYGGTSETEDAVSRGLRWLANHQDADGGWSASNFNLHCHHFTQCLGKGLEEFNVGLTGLCALAFLGAGQVPGPDGPYGRNLERALGYLMAQQRFDGAIGPRGDKFIYNHGIATFALCEAYSFTRDARYLKSVLAALNFSEVSQQAGGGWDYSDTRTGRNDLSITGWQVMAIRTAQIAEIPVSENMVQRLRSYLQAASAPNGEGIYANKGIAAGRRGVNMAAVALLSRLYMGIDLKNPWIQLAADRLLKNPPDPEKVPDWDTYFQSSYYWYSATLSLFHLGGERWEAWNHFLKRSVLPLQSHEPHEEGSWPPDGNWLGAVGGRIFTTAMNILTLEVYYRYPPLHAYQKKNGAVR